MNRIQRAFDGKKAFIPFLTAGDPSPEKTVEYILAMEKAGADLIEIGVPFSDPTAEGPVIEAANRRALANGMHMAGVFAIVEAVRRESEVPLVLLTYLNPVFRFGYDAFFQKCAQTGVDGVIIPELPFEERGEADAAAKKVGVALISMIAPTSAGRAQAIAASAEGFLYVVSSLGVTGVRGALTGPIAETISAIRAVTDVPVAVGFGIGTPEQAAAMAGQAEGVIVGSAIVSLIEKHGENAGSAMARLVTEMKAAVSGAE